MLGAPYPNINLVGFSHISLGSVLVVVCSGWLGLCLVAACGREVGLCLLVSAAVWQGGGLACAGIWEL